MAQNRNLFRLTRFILLRLPLLFKFFVKGRKPKKRLLIIKSDAIGDYILFRNFIELISRSEQYKDYEFDLVCNALCKDIALTYDADFVDEFFFIKPDDLYHAPLQTFRLGWKLFRKNYLVVLQPTYARTFITDGLAGLAAAKQTIGFEGDTERIAAKYKAKTDKYYTERLLLPQSVYFEFDRTRFFFESFLKQVAELYGPFIPINTTDKNGVVIFPGAGMVKRSWEPGKFLELIKLVSAQTPQTIYLAGGPTEIGIGKYLEENLPDGSVVNLINKTSLPELIELIGSASFIVSNETSAIHIAAATQTTAVCILGGGHFGRFAPYPEYMLSKPICVYYKMDCYYCNWNCKFITAEDEPYPCVSNVSLDAVWQLVQPLL
jgi:ADP-heptose:LPS heptosyltransferase